MKCGYAKCKLGGQVEKSIAIKRNGKYYHKDCDCKAQYKAEIELFYRSHNSKEPIVSIRKALSNYIDTHDYNPEYVLWCLKKNISKLNSLHGLSYSLSYKPNEVEFKKYKASQMVFDFGEYVKGEEIEIIESKPNKIWSDFFK